MKIQIFQDIIDVIRGKKEIKIVKKKVAKKKILSKFLVFWIGTKCTLKCRLCCNLIPYSKQISYNADEILKDLQFLLKNHEIEYLQIQGGEPFTHPDIIKIIDFVSKTNIKNIDIATNATVALKQDVLNTLKRNPNVKIRISNYECTKVAREKFCKVLDNNNIPYRFYDFKFNNKLWFSTGGINEKKANDIEVQEIFNKCKNKGCRTLADGILTFCGKATTIKEIYNDYNAKKCDEVNIRKIRKSFNPLKNKVLKKALILFFENKNTYKEQCRYCNISPDLFPAAEQLSSEEIKNLRRNEV